MSQLLIHAPPTRVFEGYPVGVGGKAHCTTCKDAVRDGDPVGAYAYQTVEGHTWDVARLFCGACNPKEVGTPTLGVNEFVMTGRLAVTADAATQEARLTLRDVAVNDNSLAGEGAHPDHG